MLGPAGRWVSFSGMRARPRGDEGLAGSGGEGGGRVQRRVPHARSIAAQKPRCCKKRHGNARRANRGRVREYTDRVDDGQGRTGEANNMGVS